MQFLLVIEVGGGGVISFFWRVVMLLMLGSEGGVLKVSKRISGT